jgi:hypothetical protein
VILFVIEKWNDKRATFLPTGNARRTFKAASELVALLNKKAPGETRQIAKYVRAVDQGKKRK